jgi:mitochondrial import receptor subunit TOM40
MSTIESIQTMLLSNPVAIAVQDALTAFSERRAKLGLPNPGTVENITREVQREVFISNLLPPGLKGEMTKTLSVAPLFQVSHQFSLAENTSPYVFAAMYGTNKTFMQGTIENTGAFGGRGNYRISDRLIAKANVQLSTRQDMAQVEAEYTGADFSASIKAMNPSVLGGGLTGVTVGQYLQSVTPKLALGLEAVWQRAAMNQGPEAHVSYMGRYKSGDWIATAQLLAQGALNATYWRRLSEQVQAGAELTLSLVPTQGVMGISYRKEGLTTVGLKYDFRMSTLRGSIDSKGRMGMLLEKRFMVPVIFQVGCDVDYLSVCCV